MRTRTLTVQTPYKTIFLRRLGLLALAGYRPKTRSGRIIKLGRSRHYVVQMVRRSATTDPTLRILANEVRRSTTTAATPGRLRRVA